MYQAVSVKTMRESDAWTIKNLISSKELMFRAGKGIYESASWEAPVLIAAGKGNNAGDGYVVASLLSDAGVPCEILLLEDRFSEDGRYYYDICVSKGIPSRIYTPGESLKKYGTIVDCLLGTGFSGEVSGSLRALIEEINASGAYVVSADINSGLNGDTGLGDCCVISDLTVSIGAYKPGHFLGRAPEVMKARTNCDIGIKIVGEILEINA